MLEDLSTEKNRDVILYLDEVLGHKVNETIWRWEFETLQNTVFTLLKDNGKIIATASMLPIKLNIAEQLFYTCKSETCYLDADYRGKKLYEKLYDFAIKKIVETGSVCVWGFTPAIKAWKRNFQFNVHEGVIKFIEIPINKYSFNKAKKNSNNVANAVIKFIIKNLITQITKLKIKFILSNSVKLVSKDYAKNTDLKEFHNSIYKKHINLVRLEIDDDYLNWRIKKNPTLKYTTKFFYLNEKLVGNVIYTIKADRLMITYLNYENQLILDAIIKYFLEIKDDFTRVYYWGNDTCKINDIIFSTFEKIGGKRKVDNTRNFIYKTFTNENLNVLSDTKNWFINGLWTEGFYM